MNSVTTTLPIRASSRIDHRADTNYPVDTGDFWHSLEEGQHEHPIPAIAQLWRQRIRAISRAQREGSVNATIHARDLLVLVFAIARAYIVTTPEVREAGRRGTARQRRAVYEAVQRLVEPV
jgi:hypothetical protein